MKIFQICRLCLVTWLSVCIFAGGCKGAKPPETLLPKPDIAPDHQPVSSDVIQLDASQIDPMFREIMAIDLTTAARIAFVDNFDILQAQQQIEASRGRLEYARGSIFPRLVPTIFFQNVQGTVQATEGNLVDVGFTTFQPSIAVQWVLNPGKVIYEIVAAKKQLAASEHHERAVVVETLRTTAVQYYELVLTQARVAASQKAVSEAEELLRINQLHSKIGTGIPANVSRAEAHLAERQQDLAIALNTFYDASVSLSLTLHLDSSVTLVPQSEQLTPIALVRDDLQIENVLELATLYRPDLESLRAMVKAVAAKVDAAWWDGFGPMLGVAYKIGGMSADDGRQSFAFKDQQRFSASAGWRWSLASFGELKVAHSFEQQALIEADRRLDEARAEVVRSFRDSNLYRELIAKSRKQLDAAEEANRLINANFETGAMTILDVLQSQDSYARAQFRHAEAVVNYNISQVNLLAALGMIDRDNLTATTM